jgi:hypothetical protein
MGVIIGAGTIVDMGGGHPTQVSWEINPNIQRAYVLGDWKPYDPAEISNPTETLNVTLYSGDLPSYDTTPTTICVDANKLLCRVFPAICSTGDDIKPSSDYWFVTSYSFSKGDARQPGQETWSMMNYVTLGDASVVLPDYVLRGISEGSVTGDPPSQSMVGVTFDGTISEGSSGSVSAGQIGRVDKVQTAVVSSVGNSLSGSGDIGQGSCSMPYTPLYL